MAGAMSCDSSAVGIDEAVISLSSELNVSVWSQSEQCWQCPLVMNGQVSVNQSKLLTMDTTFARHIVVIGQHNTSLCDFPRKTLVDHGRYYLNVSDDGTCSFTITNSPMNTNLPVFIALSVIFAASLLWILAHHFYHHVVLVRLRSTQRLVNADLGETLLSADDNVSDVAGRADLTPSRVHSVDTLRGLSLLLMVFVNYGGGHYWYFRHSAWNGLTVADLVFPWFVFVMGTSVALSFNAVRRRQVSRLSLLCRILRRTVILFMLGLVVSNRGVHLSGVRVFGVLQRLAVTYCVVAITELLCVTAAPVQLPEVRCPAVRDIVVSWPLWLVAVSLLIIHTSLTFLLDVPHCPRGYLGPGGLHADGKYANCTGGAGGYIDRTLLTASHMYRHGTYKKLYDSTTAYDPEGILGTMTSIVLCIIGVQAGKIMIVYRTRTARNVRWLIWAVVTGVVAGSLCNWSQDSGVIPVNKNLWSVSYILALSSMAFLLVTVLYNIIDVDRLWSGAPFTYLGLNSIVIYFGHEVMNDWFPVQFHIANTHAALLAVDIWGCVFWLAVAALMYHRNIFIAI